jgi:ribonuclease HII
MAYLIGTDEAGYGPNLGPLVIAGTLWEVPDRFLQPEGPEQMAQHLSSVFGSSGNMVDPEQGPWLAIADSKKIYGPSKNLAALETGVLVMLSILDALPSSGIDLLQDFIPAGTTLPPWKDFYPTSLPVVADPASLRKLGHLVRQALQPLQTRLLNMQSRILFPEEFNDQIGRSGTKGTLLTRNTLALVKTLFETIPRHQRTSCLVLCDKHGGRNRYAEQIQECFPDRFVQIFGENRAVSVYRLGTGAESLEFRFQAKGESATAPALASMMAKYLREIAMIGLNAYWSQHLPGLKPTAGYPVDAKRFRCEIESKRLELGIAEPVLWRSR